MGEGPHIFDEGRDGYPFAHIDFISEPGAWADVLPYCLNIRILPDEPLQSGLDPVEGCGDTDAPTSLPRLIAPFHEGDVSND